MTPGQRLRQLANVLNATTPLGLLLAGCARTPVRRGPRGLLIATGYRWRLPFAGAFTVGNVVLFRAGPEEALANPVLLGHEERHCTQYAWCLGLPFLPLYFLAAGWSLAPDRQPRLAQFLRTARRAAGRRLSGAGPRIPAHDPNIRNGTRHDMTDSPRTISVTGSGSAEAAPDLLTLSIGVECRREDVGAAYGEAGRVSAAITAALRGYGVADPDITTSGLNVRAEVNWQEGRGQVVSGYLASSVLSVRIRDLGASSEVIAAAVAAGGNDVRLNGLELGFADPAAVTARAREAAWQDALTTAGHFASLAGASLGKVVSLAQQSGHPAPIPVAKMQRAAAVESLTVEAGESSISATVGVVWELLG